MPATRSRAVRIVGVVVLSAMMGLIGLMGSVIYTTFEGRTVSERPAPHRVPAWPGATPLSVSMIYDVVHGLHPEHGPAWHAAVERRARATIDAPGAVPPEGPVTAGVLDAFDDLAVALDRQQRVAEAVAVMERKLVLVARTWPEPGARSPTGYVDPLGPDRRAWYRTRANRGTVRIHAALARLMGGDVSARAEVEAGLADIRQSIALNPAAHFGRERWQAYAVTGLLKAIDDDLWLRQRDLFGLGVNKDPLYGDTGLGFSDEQLVDMTEDKRLAMREIVPRYHPDGEWTDAVGYDAEGVPWDEPALAIIGMWLYGGGPNPHFAMTLGDLMWRFDQPFVAWAAYARAWQMRDRLGPGAANRDRLTVRCRDALEQLAERLGQTEDELWASFEVEQARGEAFRAAQAAYEADHPDILAPRALDAFFAGRPAIQTPPGKADRVFMARQGYQRPWLILGVTLWMAALGAWLGAGRLRAHPRA